jgi:hypothetical protein
MTRSGAETTIIVSSVVTFASLSANRLDNNTIPSGRAVASTFLAFGGLGLIAMAAPDIGAGLAMATAGTAFVLYAEPLLAKLFPDTKGKKK